MNTFQLSVVTPDRQVIDEATESVVAPGVEGYFGVMAGHEPFVTQLEVGV
ncbi:MAG: F0F1 ATP synthase subunit epsilon, partial [Armatimonadetes bacterium]|nr:F0F1 ATP synthase subunit epsilon [Armatimonadota bacterium]